jgi:hypothetical protein
VLVTLIDTTTARSQGQSPGPVPSDEGELAPEGRLVDVVDEGALAVDLDHRQPLAVARFQLGVVRDVDLRIGEAELAL